MSEGLPRVVLDNVIFIQALISGRGHSTGCIQRLRAGQFILLMSDDTFTELKDVPFRPKLRGKYPFITDGMVAAFIAEIESFSVRIPHPPAILELPRDPKDEPFINLAVAGNADFIVTWNQRHLTYLMNQDTPEGKEFRARFPTIKIVSPPAFLDELDGLLRS
jgi:putative PIN family toxin of toxin-antitoxin system